MRPLPLVIQYCQSHPSDEKLPRDHAAGSVRIPDLYAKLRPRNLGNSKAIAFSNVANRLELPSDEDFKKAETMIREFLKPSSADLPHTVDMARQILARPAKDASSSVPNDLSRPLGTKLPPPDPTKARTKRGTTKKQGELPQPTKSLVHQRKPKGSQPS